MEYKLRFFCRAFIVLLLLVISLISVNSDLSKIASEIKNNDSNEEMVVSLRLKDIDMAYSIDEVRHVFEDENIITAELTKEEIEDIAEKSYVESIDVVKPIKAFLQDSVNVINATYAWKTQLGNMNITGADETVCVIDTGVNFSHLDLLGKNVSCNIDCIGKPCVENCSVTDDHGHGTHVAGIAAANGSIKGVAFGARILAVKVLDNNGNGDEDDLAAGINYCVNNAEAYNVSVISMSLGTEQPYLYNNYCDSEYTNFASAINQANAKNISVIAATGNDYNKTSIASPACVQNTTAVAWASKTDVASSQSNSNNITDLIATGTSINSTFFGGACLPSCSCNGRYMICSGTSMATPHVAGAFALIKQYKRLVNGAIMTPGQIETVFRNNGKRISDSNGLNFSRINIQDAIVSLSLPSVYLIEPSDNYRTNRNLTFKCNASSDYALGNMTNMSFWVRNLTSLIFNENRSTEGRAVQANFSYNISSEGNYTWYCFAIDNKSYSASSANHTLIYDLTSPRISAIRPENSTYARGFFNASISEAASWCGYALDNETNVTMTRVNDTYYNFTLEGIQEGDHNITFYCNDTAGNMNYSSNVLFNINRTAPVVNSISPSNGYSTTSTTIDLTGNVSHFRNISECSLLVNGAVYSTNSTVNTSANLVFPAVFGAGSNTWHITCKDDLTNSGSSTDRTIVIQSTNNGDSSSGGGGTSSATYSPSVEELEQGYTNNFGENDKANIEINEEKHVLRINSVESDKANVTISSETINFLIKTGETKRFDLDKNSYYDLEIKLNQIENEKAGITIKSINIKIEEKVIKKEEPRKIVAFKQNDTNETTQDFNEPELDKTDLEKFLDTFKFLGIVFLLLFAVFVFMLLKNAREKTKTKPERKKEVSADRGKKSENKQRGDKEKPGKHSK